LQAKLALDALRQKITLTDYEAGDYEKGGLRFDKIIRFATIDCVKSGWMLKDKGIWSLTEEGKKAFTSMLKMELQ